jgi:hypothetical protein
MDPGSALRADSVGPCMTGVHRLALRQFWDLHDMPRGSRCLLQLLRPEQHIRARADAIPPGR